MLKLKTGESFKGDSGYEAGDQVAVVEHVRYTPLRPRLMFQVNVFKDLAAFNAVPKLRPVHSESYILTPTSTPNYSQALNAIKNRAINNDEDCIEAIDSLLLSRPFWENWEKV